MEEGHENILSIRTCQRDAETRLPEIIPTGQEGGLKEANWVNIWLLRRRSGLTPTHKSWLGGMGGLHVNNERLCKIGKLAQPTCDYCDQPDSRSHRLNCTYNKRVCKGLQQILETTTGSPRARCQIKTLG